MSDAKHSPGPWTTQHGLIYSAEGHTVASCINEDGDFSDPVRGPHDAELIASAPDLRADAERVEYCVANCLALDFAYGEHGDCVLVIKLPKHGRYPANFRNIIDAARAAESARDAL